VWYLLRAIVFRHLPYSESKHEYTTAVQTRIPIIVHIPNQVESESNIFTQLPLLQPKPKSRLNPTIHHSPAQAIILPGAKAYLAPVISTAPTKIAAPLNAIPAEKPCWLMSAPVMGVPANPAKPTTKVDCPM
jgi:hypothetical protein